MYPERPAKLDAERILDICSQLKQRKASLRSFTVAMEREFLSVGELLRTTTSLARQLREHSNHAIAAAAGCKEDASIQFAFHLLKKAEALIEVHRKQHGHAVQIFETMRTQLCALGREQESLKRILGPLAMTKVHFKLQAVSFEEVTRTQFFALADSISEIIKKVDKAVGDRFEELERANESVSGLLVRLHVESERRDRETGSMLSSIRERLDRLSDALTSSQFAPAKVIEFSNGITQGVAKAAMALQCQDMARQKLEHVCEAVDEMIQHASSGIDRLSSELDEADMLHFLADASRLQLEHIATVFQQLNQAADDVRDGLEEIRQACGELAAYAAHPEGWGMGVDLISSSTESIKNLLGLIDIAVQSIRHISDLVYELKRTFNDCTSQILDLGANLRVMALNSQIFAARVDSGAALEAIARNTRTVANLAMTELSGTSSRVNELLVSIDTLEEGLRGYGEQAAAELALLADQATQSEAKMNSLGVSIRDLTGAIGPLEANLSGVIERARKEIRFSELVANAFEQSRSPFERLCQLYYETRGSTTECATHEKLEALKKNYTMAQERLVHDSSLTTTAAISAQSVEMQTDIELF